MSTAVAPSHANPPAASAAAERQISPRQFASIAPSAPTSSAHSNSHEPSAKRARSNDSPEIAGERSLANSKSSPLSFRTGMSSATRVKKEPGSPAAPSSRPRPKRLDLSSSSSAAISRAPHTARPAPPLTSRELAGLAIQDVGIACLSPGFQTNDPSMREQLQRSLDVRDHQRQIIEARLQGAKPGSSHDSEGARTQDGHSLGGHAGARVSSNPRRKGPPPGLSINAPSAAQFANDRVIQSAPLHQTFTGLRPGEYPHTRHVQHGPSGLSHSSHVNNPQPPPQTNNRLPPISDVFPNDRLEASRGHMNGSPRGSHIAPPAPSPGFPPPQFQAPPPSTRGREFRSSEEAIQGMAGGREDMLPKRIHYGGVQPPTPPSPMPHAQYQRGAPSAHASYRPQSINGRRRGRDEYERDQGSSPPTGPAPSGPSSYHSRFGAHAAEPRHPHATVAKKEEFMRLMERAWDLFHS
ncbi:uncharacterized protein K489DRAFT_348710 [Dissoconium aciculare CBS 342.82]|uniref:Uncharacterized protein n=1 Tax=Dissoconium aciculare CBS 342.82 TaxID=1314786 RepID=A0A6J3MI61_9PEZI|nr:uncharacterized protein K489DRAFT_348710 [Dissoconium aciculare CBS 342.82]KAF1827399.1 hypothetical protein K489DRAFT_348710 [Dissoconium aciculare CBS 342.82]